MRVTEGRGARVKVLPSPRNGIQLKTSVGVEGKLGERGKRLSERGGRRGGGRNMKMRRGKAIWGRERSWVLNLLSCIFAWTYEAIGRILAKFLMCGVEIHRAGYMLEGSCDWEIFLATLEARLTPFRTVKSSFPSDHR